MEPSSSFTVIFHRQGTSPPVYIAGEFSDPPWQPCELDQKQGEDGEYTFTYHMSVATGRDYQYKFRCGSEEWLHDHTKPTVQDDSGNMNNIVRASTEEQLMESKQIYSPPPEAEPQHTTDNQESPEKILNEPEVIEADNRPMTPVEATTSLDENANKTTDGTDEVEKTDEVKPAVSDFPAPLFAHESFGAYEVVDDAMDHSQSDIRQDLRESKGFTFGDDDTDLNDPTIERFPSEKTSVMDTLRKIQSSLDEDPVHVEYAPSSPHASSRPTSVDSADDPTYSIGSLSPLSPAGSRKRGDRMSHGSFIRSHSAVSLGSIAEEPKPGDEDERAPSPSQESSSDEDAVAMQPIKTKVEADSSVTHMPYEHENKHLTESDVHSHKDLHDLSTTARDAISVEEIQPPPKMEAIEIPPLQMDTKEISSPEIETSEIPLPKEEISETRPLNEDISEMPASKESPSTYSHNTKLDTKEESQGLKPLLTQIDNTSFLTWIQQAFTSQDRAKRAVLTGVVAVALGFAWWKSGGKNSPMTHMAGSGGY